MKNEKRFISLLLCLVFCLSLFPASAFAEGEITEIEAPVVLGEAEASDEDPLIMEGEAAEESGEPAPAVQDDAPEETAEESAAGLQEEDGAPEPAAVPVDDAQEDASIADPEDAAVVPTDPPAAEESLPGSEPADTAAETGEKARAIVLENELTLEEDPSPDVDLLDAYAQQELDKLRPSRPLLRAPKNVGASLSGGSAVVYRELKGPIAEVAAGRRSSTEFQIPLTTIFNGQTRWTSQNTGIQYLVSDGEVTDEFIAYFFGEIGLFPALCALLFDCPYELYWFDKTTSIREYVSGNIEIDEDKNEVYIDTGATYNLCFPVAEEYVGTATYTVDTTKGRQVQSAVTNAQRIVSGAANLNLLAKLVEYRDQICSLTSYNHDAVNDTSTPYGNPWQMVWVFDGDSTTNVVCEGYSKAFQYLCDISDIGSATCYTVTGLMGDSSGSGGHMWNIVSMPDGRNYLVDVTNCDSGSVGAPDKLFLKGYTSSKNYTQYTFRISGYAINYSYDELTLSTFTEEDLTLSGQDYEETATPIRLSNSSISVPAGFRRSLVVSGTNAPLIWSSDDPDVAAVTQSGVVIGVKAGRTTVRVRTSDGTASAECSVQVLFTDVTDAEKYFYDAVYWALDNDITTGITPTTFAPNASCTREQIVVFLWRLMGCPAPSAGGRRLFQDVKAGSWYYDAVYWAKEQGITTGLTPTSFGVGRPCTREQCVTFLWRAVGSPLPTERASFRDVKAGSWYEVAVSWAQEKGITTGLTPTNFGVGVTCSRGQIVTFLQRFDALG